MNRTRTGGPLQRRKALILGGIGVLVIGLLLGRALSPSSSPSEGAGPRASAGAERSLGGVPVGFPRTARGAAEAVAAYQRAFADTAVLRPGVLRSRIGVVATPDYAATMLKVNSPGTRRLAVGPVGVGVKKGVQTLYASVPIGYRVESFESGRARILTWGLTLLGNASSVEPAAYFGVTQTELVWMDDRWRIAETRGGFGPTPKLATPPGPLGGYRVMDLARELRSYDLAP